MRMVYAPECGQSPAEEEHASSIMPHATCMWHEQHARARARAICFLLSPIKPFSFFFLPGLVNPKG